MIQFYINSRPVPRAIARHRIQESTSAALPQIEKKIKEALSGDAQALAFLRAYGVDIHREET